jgi:hypothetical protein
VNSLRSIRTSLSCLLLLVAACEQEEAPSVVVPATGGVGALAAGQVGAAPLARLVSPAGEVRLERQGKWEPAAEGPLWRGDAVETGPKGRVTVRFSDGRMVEVGPEARFVLGEDECGVVLEVARGFVLSRVPASVSKQEADARVQLTILTPFGFTRVGSEESEVKVEVGEDEGRVQVSLGSVEVVAKNGQAVRASGGQSF